MAPPADTVSLDPLALPIARLRFTVLLDRPARFRFVHTGALSGLLRAALDTHDLHPGVHPVGPEMGRVRVEAGESYTFGVTLAGGACSMADEIIAGIARVGRSKEKKPLALHGNFELARTERLPNIEWGDELPAWRAERDALVLRMVSPVRIPRPAKDARPSAGYFNDDYFPLEGFLTRVATRIIALATGRPATHTERRATMPVIPPEAVLEHGHLVWVDMPVGSEERDDPSRENGYTKGGVLGRLTLRGLNDAWLHWLAVVCETGIGEGTRFGLGRLRRSAAHPVEDWCRPEGSMLERMLHPAELRVAAGHFGDEAEAILDDITDAEVAGEYVATAALREGTYRAEELGGFILPKDERRVRALAVPPLRERLLQRAAAAQLTPSVDALFDECSFAYRKGLSHRTAAREVARAQREGFEWVLDADITSFFDHVDWGRLRDKLEALFPYEPLVRVLMEWVRAPVRFDGRLVERTRGVPQGAVISPVLANLYLDELDDALMGDDFRLVRYADDFVILCRDLASATRARDEARAVLERLNLTLHPEKTQVTSFDDGFSYLGYLFLRSAVVERESVDQKDRVIDGATFTAEGIPPASWLAQVPFEDVRRVALQQTGRAKRVREERARSPGTSRSKRERIVVRQAVEVAPVAGAVSAPVLAGVVSETVVASPAVAPAPVAPMDADRRDRDAQRRPIHIVDEQARLLLRGGTLVIERPSGPPIECPLGGISHITLLGASRMTVPLLLSLGEHGVPVFFCRRNGSLRTAVHYQPDWALWRAQLRLGDDLVARTAFSKRQIAAKLRNSARMIATHDVADGEGVAARLRQLADSVAGMEGLDGVRGKEGAGAALVFQAFHSTLPAEWGFSSRNRQPPRDPVNAFLSFGYGTLYRHLTTALVAAGLNPRLGLYHVTEGTHDALASDLVEEYRYLVEGLLLAMIARKELAPAMFEEDPERGCRLGADARRKVVDAIERRLLTEFTAADGRRVTYRAQMDLQASRLAAFVRGGGPEYVPHEAI